jgi:hypothetical protein
MHISAKQSWIASLALPMTVFLGATSFSPLEIAAQDT